MGNIRDELRSILEGNLILEFKNHHAFDTLDSYNATIKLVSHKIDNTIDLIIDVFKNNQL